MVCEIVFNNYIFYNAIIVASTTIINIVVIVYNDNNLVDALEYINFHDTYIVAIYILNLNYNILILESTSLFDNYIRIIDFIFFIYFL